MRVVDHPFIPGVKCREDGAIFIPAVPGHWTFGCRRADGYFVVGIARKRRRVHRLICEAFHGPCPPGKCQVDHIDRDPSNNKPENLRWVTGSENQHNRADYARCGVSAADDRAAYHRARWHTDPEFREKQKARMKARYAKKKKAEHEHPCEVS